MVYGIQTGHRLRGAHGTSHPVKPVLVTQRIDQDPNTGELREGLDVRWTAFLGQAGLFPIPVPGGIPLHTFLAHVRHPVGILLTGGNTVGGADAGSQRRDLVERELLSLLPQKRILGVCHGLQTLVMQAGGSLKPIADHVRRRHPLTVEGSRWLKSGAGFDVNSYHGDGIDDPGSMKVVARAPDGSIEAAETEMRLGIMWHPERESPFRESDLQLFREFFA